MKSIKIDNKTPIFQLTVEDFLSILRKGKEPQTVEQNIPEIFGIKTLQEITDYSKASIYSKTSKKEIPHFRRDGRLFFRRDEIMEWLTAKPVKTVHEHCRERDQRLTKRNWRNKS